MDAKSVSTDAPPTQNGNANGTIAPPVAGKMTYGERRIRLRLNPNNEHRPDRYDDVQSEFEPALFSSLERHFPPSMLEVSRDVKLQFMKEILSHYWPAGERNRVQKQKDYRQKLLSVHKRLHNELYSMHPSAFFVPSFLQAIYENTEESFRRIVSEPLPGIFTFPILQPSFCELLLEEVENLETCVSTAKFKLIRPNTMNKFGAVLDDIGLESMLNKFMEDFISPLSKIFFPEVGGATLDSHHGFVVEYGEDKDVDSGFHVDDSEVTVNICLGKEFSGGELFFRGVRCEQHINTDAHPEEIYDYYHVPGQAVFHRGCHRHGARAITSGHRINMLLWCRSSVFREMKRYQKDFSGWCGECQREKRERQRQSVAATKLAFIRSGLGSFI